jgi:DNA-binding FrmR family transcriptional regulator
MEECCKHKHQPRSQKELKDLKNRIHRMSGQLDGIERMLEDNRYCGDILIQISAVQCGLEQLASKVLKTHIETCVVQDLQEGKMESVDELIGLIKKIK